MIRRESVMRLRDGVELRWQLSLVIGLLLTATLIIAALISIRSAQHAVREEVGASLRAAEANLDVTLSLLEGRSQAEVEAALSLWSAAYAEGRHLCVAIERSGAAQFRCREPAGAALIPDWFKAGISETAPPVIRTVQASTTPLRVLLVSDPHDEMREAWGEVHRLLLLMAVLAFVVNLCVFAVVSRALSPLQSLVTAMDRLGRGERPGALPRGGALETRRLSQVLSLLSDRLAHSRESLRAMHLKHLELQEEERRMVARELHDEIGQHVAAIEMETIRIGRLQAQDNGEREERLKVLRSLVAEIHRVSRRVVQRLLPPAIERLGLGGALQSLFDRWRTDHPQVTLHTQIELGDTPLDDARAVHLYRIVQESLTNAARHADADTVRVQLVIVDGEARLHVVDDGQGFDPLASATGYGLSGMRERVEALSGTLRLQASPGAGTLLEVSLPPVPGSG